MKERERILSTTFRHHAHSWLFIVMLTIFSALAIAVLLASSNIVYGNVPWTDHWFGYAVVGVICALFFFGAERIWYSTIAPMIQNPSGWFGAVTQLPFWFFAGACGYTLGLIVAKKFGLLTVYDIPIKPFFRFGGMCGTVFQTILFLAGTKIQKTYNFFHDKSRTA